MRSSNVHTIILSELFNKGPTVDHRVQLCSTLIASDIGSWLALLAPHYSNTNGWVTRNSHRVSLHDLIFKWHAMWLLSFVPNRSALQRDPFLIWLWHGAHTGAPASSWPSLLHRVAVALAAPPLQEPEQPRHPVVRVSGVHAVGNVPGSTPSSNTQ